MNRRSQALDCGDTPVTRASEAILHAAGALTDSAPNAQLVKDLVAYDLFLEIKELAGLERAVGSVGFAKRRRRCERQRPATAPMHTFGVIRMRITKAYKQS